jgi:hypothetical protein
LALISEDQTDTEYACDAEPFRLGVRGVKEELYRLRHDRTRHTQQNAFVFLVSKSRVISSRPALVVSKEGTYLRSLDFQQLEFRRQIVRADVDADVGQSRGGIFCQINNQTARIVSSSASSQSTHSAEIMKPADSPQNHQTNMPSSI